MQRSHDMPFGARLTGNGTEFGLWAPAAKHVDLRLSDSGVRIIPMMPEANGWFTITVPEDMTSRRYLFLIDGADAVPDPAARFQPQGPDRPSEIVNPRAYEWRDEKWNGRPWQEAVLYELHIGTFTAEGTFRAAIERLHHLAQLGVTALEIMPVAEFMGEHNWGYDGVDLFAVSSRYGRPEDFKALIDAAHAYGLMIVLDVVWNHFGPLGNYLTRYAPQFFTDAHKTPWGGAINFDQAGSDVVRDFYRHNALYWAEEFNLDGLRIDAIHAIKDDSATNILADIAGALRTANPDRHFHLIDENELNGARLLARDAKGDPTLFTAQWNDDFHHPVHVMITGESDAYYIDYAEQPMEKLGRALAEGFGYQGEASPLRDGEPRGEPSAFLPPLAFVPFLQNHDQIGNRPFGDRLVTMADPAALRAAVAILLLSPQIPLLFMGEEWGSHAPFPYFCDVGIQLGEMIRRSRAAEFAIGKRFADPQQIDLMPDPMAVETFWSAKLDWQSLSKPRHGEWLGFYRRLLTLRRNHIVPLLTGIGGNAGHYHVSDQTLLRVDWDVTGTGTLTLVANFGAVERTSLKTDAGQIIFASHPNDAPGQFSPWSVRWSILKANA